MKFAPLKPKFLIFFLGLFLSPFFLSAQGFESWKDLHIYYKKNNFEVLHVTSKFIGKGTFLIIEIARKIMKINFAIK